MTNNLVNTSKQVKIMKRQNKNKQESILVFLRKHKFKLGHSFNAVDLVNKYSGRG